MLFISCCGSHENRELIDIAKNGCCAFKRDLVPEAVLFSLSSHSKL